MKIIFGLVPFFVALPIVVASAIWQGGKTERWGKFPELDVCAARIDKIPLQIGDDWKGKLGPKMDENIRKYAGAVGDTQIVYTNTVTHKDVRLLVVCGRLQDVWNHRPDRCYPAHGYKQETDPREQKVTDAENAPSMFLTSIYALESNQSRVRVYWGWSSNGKWVAPDDLRQDFMRTDPIFKIQVEAGVAQDDEPADRGPAVDFIKVALPELNRVLFPGYKPPVRAAQGTATANDSAAVPAASSAPAKAETAK